MILQSTPLIFKKAAIDILDKFTIKQIKNIRKGNCPYCKSLSEDLFITLGIEKWMDTLGIYHADIDELNYLFGYGKDYETRQKQFSILENIFSDKEVGFSMNYLKCSVCGLIFDSYPFDMNILDYFYTVLYRLRYEDKNKRYGRFDDQKFVSRKERTGKYLLEKIGQDLLKKSAILEIGCAEGILCRYLQEQGFEAHGIDSCEQQILFGKEVVSINNLHSASYLKTEFGENRFDVIVARHTIEHVYEQEMLFNKMDYELRDGGFLLIQVPNADCIRESDEALHYVLGPGHLVAYSQKSLMNIFKSRQYEIVEMQITPYNDPQFAYLTYDIKVSQTGDNPGSISLLAKKTRHSK